jgi:hypothetical protein
MAGDRELKRDAATRQTECPHSQPTWPLPSLLSSRATCAPPISLFLAKGYYGHRRSYKETLNGSHAKSLLTRNWIGQPGASRLYELRRPDFGADPQPAGTCCE